MKKGKRKEGSRVKYDTDRIEEGRMNKRRNVDRKRRPKEERRKEGRIGVISKD